MAEYIVSTVSSLSLIVVALLFQALVVVSDNDDGAHVVNYDSMSFKEALRINKNLVMFHAPWCGHCKNLSPIWDKLGELYNKKGNTPIIIGKVDCTVHTELCAEQEIIGFPTIKLFLTPTTVKRYAGKRDLDTLRNYVEGHLNDVDVQLDGSENAEGDEVRPPVPEDKDSLIILTDDNFKETISDGFVFVKFYAPWCGHCKKLEPIWDDLAATFSDSEEVAIAKIDCTVFRPLCGEYGIKGYPTLLWFQDGKQMKKYQFARTHEALKKFVNDEIAQAVELPEEEEDDPVDDASEDDEEAGKDLVKELTVANFKHFLSTRLVFVKFYAPWCGHCKRLVPTWEELARDVVDSAVSIAKVDCTQHKSVCDDFSVRGYPTLKMFRNGEKVEDYKGARSLDDLHSFVKRHLELGHDEL